MTLRGFRNVSSNDEMPKITVPHVQIRVFFTFLTIVILVDQNPIFSPQMRGKN